MRKLLCILLIVVVLSSLLSGCNIGYFTCDLCCEDTFGNMHREDVLGTEIVYCDECQKRLETLGLK